MTAKKITDKDRAAWLINRKTEVYSSLDMWIARPEKFGWSIVRKTKRAAIDAVIRAERNVKAKK